MKPIFTYIITICLALSAQNAEQIKKQLKNAGIKPEQARQMAKDQGYTDKQIETEARYRDIDIDVETKNKYFQPIGAQQVRKDSYNKILPDNNKDKDEDLEDNIKLEKL